MADCLIGLGANLGDRERTLAAAVARLSAAEGVTVRAQSRWHETAPAGGLPDQPAFLNGAVRLETSLAPGELLELLHEIERDLGRQAGPRWAARPIDLDLLLYDELVLESPQLVVPHPRMAVRRFVLEPAAEIGGDLLHPTIRWTVRRLLDHALDATAYLAIAGPPGIGKTRLAREMCQQTAARFLADPDGAGQAPRAAGSGQAGGEEPMAASAWGQGPDCASPEAAREIEFLARRSEVLARRGWPDTARWSVSDFWIEQSMAWAEAVLDDAGRAAVLHAWQALQEHVVPPKLLVVLDAPEHFWVKAGPEARSDPGWDATAARRAHEELLTRARRPGRGPVLWVSAADWQGAVAEVSAAMSAMQP